MQIVAHREKIEKRFESKYMAKCDTVVSVQSERRCQQCTRKICQPCNKMCQICNDWFNVLPV